MKFSLLLIAITSFSNHVEANAALRDLLDRHSDERHEAKKGWDTNKRECQATYPNWFRSDHQDYDKNFECQKKIREDKNAFEDKQKAEVCQKFNVACKT